MTNSQLDNTLDEQIDEILIYPSKKSHDNSIAKDIRQHQKQQILTLIEQSNNREKAKYEADIAHAIGYCQGLGHPDIYLQNRYRHLIELQTILGDKK